MVSLNFVCCMIQCLCRFTIVKRFFFGATITTHTAQPLQHIQAQPSQHIQHKHHNTYITTITTYTSTTFTTHTAQTSQDLQHNNHITFKQNHHNTYITTITTHTAQLPQHILAQPTNIHSAAELYSAKIVQFRTFGSDGAENGEGTRILCY
jgi:hypothetical protein